MLDAPSQFVTSPAALRELEKHPIESRKEIFNRAKQTADADDRAVLADDIIIAAQSVQPKKVVAEQALRAVRPPAPKISHAEQPKKVVAEQALRAVRPAMVGQLSTAAAGDISSLPMLPGRRPLMPLAVLTYALYKSEDDVMNLIGERRLIAFKVGSPKATRSKLVIWVQSILDYLANKPPTRATNAAIMADVFPGVAASYRLPVVCRLFGVCNSHLHRLLALRHLDPDPARPVAPRSSLSPWITRESLVKFLSEGRVS